MRFRPEPSRGGSFGMNPVGRSSFFVGKEHRAFQMPTHCVRLKFFKQAEVLHGLFAES